MVGNAELLRDLVIREAFDESHGDLRLRPREAEPRANTVHQRPNATRSPRRVISPDPDRVDRRRGALREFITASPAE
jgi:hypothetical protein